MLRHLRLRDAPAYDLTRSILRGRTWTPVSYGLYQRSALTADEVCRLQAMRDVLPGGAAWSHFTGARLFGLWLPHLPHSLPLMATIQPTHTRPERDGLYVARSRARLPAPVVLAGLPVLSVPRVLGQLAEDLSLLDLVVAIDCALQHRWCSESDIFAAVVARQRGIRMLRAAMPFADGRSESVWETVLRLFHVLCGSGSSRSTRSGIRRGGSWRVPISGYPRPVDCLSTTAVTTADARSTATTCAGRRSWRGWAWSVTGTPPARSCSSRAAS